MKLLFILILSSCVNKMYVESRIQYKDTNIKTQNISNVGKVGQYQLNTDYTVANWLNAPYKGKTIQEPINLLIIDKVSNSSFQAINRLLQSTSAAGYEMRFGHSNNYKAYLGDSVFSQLPNESCCTFSDRFFIFPNNHGRIFGPYYKDGYYVFIAAFSKEGVGFSWPYHTYESFVSARDNFAINLNKYTEYKIIDFIDMKNYIEEENKILSSGDHDGFAVILSTVKE
jgi:hypothetical protein